MKHFQQIKTKTQLNTKLELLGLVVTCYDDHKTVHHQIKQLLQKLYKGKVLEQPYATTLLWQEHRRLERIFFLWNEITMEQGTICISQQKKGKD